MIKCRVTLEHHFPFRQPAAARAPIAIPQLSRTTSEIPASHAANCSPHFPAKRASQLPCFHILTNYSHGILFALISLRKYRGVGVQLHHNCATSRPLSPFKNNSAEKSSLPPPPFAVSLPPPLPVEYTGPARGEVHGQ